MYEKRLIDNILKEYLAELPAILIEGAKAVGKTETCSHLAKTIYPLDNEPTRLLLTASPETILQDKKPVLLDEWQLAPELWTYVRHQVDQGLKIGSVLLTGSSIKINSRIHSGAGRIVRLKLRPYSIEERQMSEKYISVGDLFEIKAGQKVSGKTNQNINNYLDEIYRSGLPEIRKKSALARNLLLNSYLDNILSNTIF